MKGGRTEVTVKTAADHSSMRLGPNTTLNHAAERQTASWAEVKAVENHDPSSKPNDRPPRRSLRPTDVRRVLIVEIKAPTMTAVTPISGWALVIAVVCGPAAGPAAVVSDIPVLMVG